MSIPKRPEKAVCRFCKNTGKAITVLGDDIKCNCAIEIKDRNQAIDEFDKFLPSGDEIVKIIEKSIKRCGNYEVFDMEKAISKRLRGEK